MRYNAKAIGSGSEGAQSELIDSWHKVQFFFSFFPFFLARADLLYIYFTVDDIR
jgi:hypothetical protein